MSKKPIKNVIDIDSMFSKLNEMDKDIIVKFVVKGNKKCGQIQKYYSPNEKLVYNGRTISSGFHPTEQTIKKWFKSGRKFTSSPISKLCKLGILYKHPGGRAKISYNMNPKIAYPILKKMQEEYEKSKENN